MRISVMEVPTLYVSENLWWTKDGKTTGVADYHCQHLGAKFVNHFDINYGVSTLELVCPGCDGRDMSQADIDDLYEEHVNHTGGMSE